MINTVRAPCGICFHQTFNLLYNYNIYVLHSSGPWQPWLVRSFVMFICISNWSSCNYSGQQLLQCRIYRFGEAVPVLNHEAAAFRHPLT